MNSAMNEVIYRFNSDEAFRAAVQEDPDAVLLAIESLSVEEREILSEVFARKPDLTSLPNFLTRGPEVRWNLPIIVEDERLV